MPVEKAVEAIATPDRLRALDRELIEKLAISPAYWKKLNDESGIELNKCQYQTQRTTINYDGSVALCCATYDTDKIISTDFTKASKQELLSTRQTHSYCDTCMSNKLHYVYTGVYPKALNEAVAQVFGEPYRAYLKYTEQVGDLDKIPLRGELKEIQEIYDKAYALLPKNIKFAEELFDAIYHEAPEFGEGVYQSAIIKAAQGKKQEALLRIETICSLYPENMRYSELRQKIIDDEAETYISIGRLSISDNLGIYARALWNKLSGGFQ